MLRNKHQCVYVGFQMAARRDDFRLVTYFEL